MIVRIVIQFPFYNINTLEVKRDGASIVGSYLSFLCIVIEWYKCYWLVMYYVLPRYSFSKKIYGNCLHHVRTSWIFTFLFTIREHFLTQEHPFQSVIVYLHLQDHDYQINLFTYTPNWLVKLQALDMYLKSLIFEVSVMVQNQRHCCYAYILYV